MTSRRPFFLACFLLLTALLFPLLPTSALAEDFPRDKALDRLRVVELFAFARDGFVDTSRGELDFRIILTSPTAEADFLELLKTGSPEGQCYALVGLYRKSRPICDEQIRSFADDQRIIQSRYGCIGWKQRVSQIIPRISQGAYNELSASESDPKK